jgi:hypothetical protein
MILSTEKKKGNAFLNSLKKIKLRSSIPVDNISSYLGKVENLSQCFFSLAGKTFSPRFSFN